MTKRKYIILIALAALFIAIGSLFCFFGGGTTASAASYTTGRYRLDIDLVYQVTPNTARDFEVYMSGNTSSTSVSGTIKEGDTLKFIPQKLEIVIPAGSANQWHTQHARIFNVKLAGPVTFSSPNYNEGSTSENITVSFILSNLKDGDYTLSFESQIYYRANNSGGWRNPETTTFSFVVDSGESLEKDPCEDGHSYSAKVTLPTCTSNGYTTYTCRVCGYSNRDNTTAALGHSYTSSTTASSCTEGGYTVYTCSRCGNSYTGNVTSATGHSYSAKVTSPACTGEGYVTYTCTKCNYSYIGNRTEALGHSYSATTSSSSCTSGGYTLYKCSRCGVSYTDSPTQATGHSYVAKIIAPTCTERGYTIYTCSKCGDSYRTNETSPLGHNYIISTEGATCTVGGVNTYTCTRCNSSYEGGVSAPLGHNYVAEQLPASCTEEGSTVYTCSRCGASYNGEPTAPLGHSYVSRAVAATCEEGGYTIHTCSRCGDSYTENEIQPLGHNFITEERPASCTEGASIAYICQVCGYKEINDTGTYPTGHDYTSTLIQAATCTTEGKRLFVCDACGYEYTEIVPATGHSYAITDSTSEDGITTRTYTCTSCGDSYTQELGDQYEEVVSYVEYLFEQYQPYMWWVLLATAGIWSIVMGVFYAIAHKNEDRGKTKKMIVNYIVGLVIIFVILVACPYLVSGIAALVT